MSDAIPSDPRCKCDPESWVGGLDLGICSDYVEHEQDEGRCVNCEHDEACHEHK